MRLLATVVFLFTSFAGSGFAASVGFQQGGWTSGGPLLVSFAGEDSDRDGLLVATELSEFQASWTDPAERNVQWAFDDIERDGFVYGSLDNFLMFVTNGEYSLVSTGFEGEVLSSVFDTFLFPVAESVDPASAVPEPASFIFVGSGSLFIFFRARFGRG